MLPAAYTDGFWAPTLALAAIFGARYLALAGLAFALLYRRRVANRLGKLQRAWPSLPQIAREIGWASTAVLVFGAATGLLTATGAIPHTRLYLDVAEHGWPWFVASIAVAIVLHDTWFYWTHRLLHWRPLFRHVHRVHHRSTNPTPWTAYAFHPLESVVQAAGVVLIVFVVPMHPLALALFQTISTAVNVYGHCGYELYPRGFAAHPAGRWINTSVAHNAHHRTGRHNYGFYFLFWDRLLRTLDPGYDAAYEAVTRPHASARTSPAHRSAP